MDSVASVASVKSVQQFPALWFSALAFAAHASPLTRRLPVSRWKPLLRQAPRSRVSALVLPLMRCAWVLALSSRLATDLPVRGACFPQRGRMVRIASALGLVMFSVALLILSLISYVSIKKDFLLSTPRYGPNGGPRMYMFHSGFRWVWPRLLTCTSSCCLMVCIRSAEWLDFIFSNLCWHGRNTVEFYRCIKHVYSIMAVLWCPTLINNSFRTITDTGSSSLYLFFWDTDEGPSCLWGLLANCIWTASQHTRFSVF